MKLISLFTLTILTSVSLTSCWQKTEEKSEMSELDSTVDIGTDSEVHKKINNNVIYLHANVTRGQDPKAIFNNYVQSGNVVVDFYADWCHPCTLMGNTINQVASQFPSVTFLKVNVDQFESLAGNIRSLPTLIFYKNGTQISQVRGFKDRNAFIALLKQSY